MAKLIKKKDTWNLDLTLAKYIRKVLKQYVKDCNKVVDLSYYKFNFHNKEITEKEAISYIIKKCKEYEKKDEVSLKKEEKITKKMQEAMHLLADIFPTLWW